MVIGLTGATGFVGRHFLRHAVAQGHEVVAFSRNPNARVAGAREVRMWSPEAAPDLTGCDAVVHLAGESILGLWTRSKRAAIRDSRILGTRRLVAAMAATPSGPGVFVCASAIGFYGDRGDECLVESLPPGSGFLAEVTREWENEAERARASGTRVVCGRFGLILGRDGGAWPVVRRVFGLGVGGRLGSGRQWASWVHVEDVAAVLLRAVIDGRYDGPVNVVSPNPVTNAEFTRAVARALRRPAILPVPAMVLRAVLRDQAGLFLGSQRVLPQAAQALGYSFGFPTLESALNDLGSTV